VADVLERGGVEKESQLDRIESHLSALARGQYLQSAAAKPIEESFIVATMGGIDAWKALNRKRAAEQRRKKK
jgi:hypothetical protein